MFSEKIVNILSLLQIKKITIQENSFFKVYKDSVCFIKNESIILQTFITVIGK